MSLEESMATLAESNLKLATAMNRYADVIEKVGLGVTSGKLPAAAVTTATNETSGETAQAETTGKGKGRGKAKPAAEAPAESNSADNEPDPFGDEDPFGDAPAAVARTYTADDVRNVLGQVKDTKGKDEAVAIIRSAGAATIGQIAEKDYAKVVEAAIKLGAKL